jgi:hypothetical protein
MKKLFLFVSMLFVFYFSKCYPQERWVYIGDDEDNTSVYFDKETIKYENSEINIFLKYVYPGDSKTNWDKKYAIAKWTIYCKKESIYAHNVTIYYRNGLIEKYNLNLYRETLPETFAEIVFNLFCK